MQNENVLKRHAALLDWMASARGIDLEEAAMRGRIGLDDVSEAVLRCTSCSNPDHCAQWLDALESVADATPGYCRNADLFLKLQPGPI